jgi:RNA polymerase sigma-70 factor (ECF subfamily)
LDRRTQAAGEELCTLADLLAAEADSASDQLERQERVEWVRAAVTRLPETLRTSVQLVYFQGLKYREAADELAVPVGTVKSRLHSAVVKLREAWAQSCFATV